MQQFEGRATSNPEATAGERARSPLSADNNFIDMCRTALVKPEEVLAFFDIAGSEGMVTQNCIQSLLEEFANNHPGNSHVLRSGATGVGKAQHRRKVIEDQVIALLQVVKAEVKEDAV